MWHGTPVRHRTVPEWRPTEVSEAVASQQQGRALVEEEQVVRYASLGRPRACRRVQVLQVPPSCSRSAPRRRCEDERASTDDDKKGGLVRRATASCWLYGPNVRSGVAW